MLLLICSHLVVYNILLFGPLTSSLLSMSSLVCVRWTYMFVSLLSCKPTGKQFETESGPKLQYVFKCSDLFSS